MEDFGWERNMFPIPWSNINHYQQESEESIIFGSENIFFNPILDLPKTGSTPITSATGHQIGSHSQLAPASLDSINVPSGSDSASQYSYQTLTVNCLHEGRNVIPLTTTTVTSIESPDCLRHLSSDDSATKETDDSIVSQISPDCLRHLSSDPVRSSSSTINFRQSTSESDETDSEVIAQMKETIYRAAAFRPVSFEDEEAVKKPRRKNVRISSDPQTVAARKRREKVSERIRVLQKLVPGGNKMDTASMLDEAANYMKFLRSQVKALEQYGQKLDYVSCGTSNTAYSTSQNIQNFDGNLMLGVPFPMQTHILLPYQQIYRTPPPS